MTETEYSTSQSEIVNDFLTKNLILKEEEYRLINGFIDPNKLMKLKLLYSTIIMHILFIIFVMGKDQL